jgi:hypothetical protein
MNDYLKQFFKIFTKNNKNQQQPQEKKIFSAFKNNQKITDPEFNKIIQNFDKSKIQAENHPLVLALKQNADLTTEQWSTLFETFKNHYQILIGSTLSKNILNNLNNSLSRQQTIEIFNNYFKKKYELGKTTPPSHQKSLSCLLI